MSAPTHILPTRLLAPRVRSLYNRWHHAPTRERVAYSIFGVVGLLFWVSLFGGLIYAVDSFYEVEVFGPLITRKLLELLLLALFGMLVFSNIVTALSTFYLSDDLELLLSLPVGRATFFYTRFFDTLAQSSWMMAMFGLPVFLAFGIAANAGAAYYLSLLAVIPALVWASSSTHAYSRCNRSPGGLSTRA